MTEHLTDTTARYRQTAGPAALTHDANGDLAQECSGSSCTAYVYDPENRLVAVTGARQAQLRYDPYGRLHAVSGPGGTTRFVYDGDDLVMEYDGAGVLRRRYVHGSDDGDNPIAWPETMHWGGTMEAANERFLRTDERGSVVAVATAGSTLAINRYDGVADVAQPQSGIPAATNACPGPRSGVGRFQYSEHCAMPVAWQRRAAQAWLPGAPTQCDNV